MRASRPPGISATKSPCAISSACQVVVRGVLTTEPQVGCHGSGEQERLLRHVADPLPHAVEIGVAHVDAADADGAAGHVEQARDERDERRLARTGRADDRDRLTGIRAERDALEDGPGTRVGEGHVVEGDGARSRELRHGLGGASQRVRRLQHLADAVGRDRGARDHDRHERRHEHAHEDLADVLHECEQRADLHVSGIHLDAAEPDDAHDGDVEDQHGQREHQDEQRPDLAADDHDVGVGGAEARLFDAFADERADDADAGELLAHDAVHAVELALVLAEQRHHAADDRHGDDEQHGHRDGDEPAETDVLLQRHDDAADREQRRRDEHRRAHHREHLHLLDVVRVARDERSRAECRHFALGESAHLLVDVAADVAADAHRGARGEVRRDDGCHDLSERDREHEHPARPDVARVTGGDTVVDDVGVQPRQVEEAIAEANWKTSTPASHHG
jgi:hypothetical protein